MYIYIYIHTLVAYCLVPMARIDFAAVRQLFRQGDTVRGRERHGEVVRDAAGDRWRVQQSAQDLSQASQRPMDWEEKEE